MDEPTKQQPQTQITVTVTGPALRDLERIRPLVAMDDDAHIVGAALGVYLGYLQHYRKHYNI